MLVSWHSFLEPTGRRLQEGRYVWRETPACCLSVPARVVTAPCLAVRSLELYSLLEFGRLGSDLAKLIRAPVLRAFSGRRAYLARLDEIIS